MWAVLPLLLLLLLPPLLPPLRHHLRHHFRQLWAAPDLNMELQIAVGSAGPQQRAPDCSVQRRTSTASPRLQWAAPDLIRGALERTGQRRTSPGELPSGVGSAGPQLPQDIPKDMSEICQSRMSEDMSKEMSEDMSIEMSEKNVRKNVRRYVRRYVKKERSKIYKKKCQ